MGDLIPQEEGAIFEWKTGGQLLSIETKTAEPIEMTFGMKTRVGPKNHILQRGRDPSGEGHF